MVDDDGERRQAYRAAVRLLAAREHSRAELKRKLERQLSVEAVEALLDELAAEGLQSDDRFVESYLHSRMERGFGPLRIRAELQERGIDEARIRLALEAVEEQWKERLLRVARRKFGDDPPGDRREMGRRFRFLAGRGFPEHLIRDYLFS